MHYLVSMLREMSSAVTEWVSAPTLTYVTPVAAMVRMDERVTLPEASVSARSPMRPTAWRCGPSPRGARMGSAQH
jgi:hypothetical protein